MKPPKAAFSFGANKHGNPSREQSPQRVPNKSRISSPAAQKCTQHRPLGINGWRPTLRSDRAQEPVSACRRSRVAQELGKESWAERTRTPLGGQAPSVSTMGKRHPNHRRVKIHRSYTVDEIARLFGIHKNTVRQWLKSGLPTIDNRRPTMARGADLNCIPADAPGCKETSMPARPNLLCPLPRSEVSCRPHGRISTYCAQDREPHCHLPGLRLPYQSEGESRQVGSSSRRNGHHVSASTVTTKRE